MFVHCTYSPSVIQDAPATYRSVIALNAKLTGQFQCLVALTHLGSLCRALLQLDFSAGTAWKAAL